MGLVRGAAAAALAVAVLGMTACGTSSREPAPSASAVTQAEYASASQDWNSAYVECARSFGADATIDWQGSIQNPVAAGRPMIDYLDADCVDRLGMPPAPPPLNDQLLRGTYALLHEQAACLETLGYRTDPPPSRDEFIERYGDEGTWSPLGSVFRDNPDVDPVHLIQACPDPDPVEAEALGAEL